MSNQATCATALTPRVSEINDAENRIDRAISMLNDNTAQFIDRVSAVLRTGEPGCQVISEKKPESTVRLAIDINAFARRVEDINDMVINANNRVEI